MSKSGLERAKEKASVVALEKTDAVARQQSLSRFWQMVGGIKVADAIRNNLTSQSLRTLELIKTEKLYRDAGYATFDQFLDKSPDSPMSHDAYLRRMKALEAEGDAVFDTFNAIGLSLAKRRALAGGAIEIDGEEIVVRDGDDESRIPLRDRAQVLSVLSQLADKNAQNSRTIERGRKEVERLKRKVDEAKNAAPRLLDDSNPHDRALSLSLVALGGLKSEAEKMSLEQKLGARDDAMRMLSTMWADLRVAYAYEVDAQATDFAREHLSDDDVDDLIG